MTLTESALVANSLRILLNWSEHPYVTMRIFKRVAAFLRELANDNEHVKGLYSEELVALV
jgi:hypothetical protein